MASMLCWFLSYGSYREGSGVSCSYRRSQEPLEQASSSSKWMTFPRTKICPKDSGVSSEHHLPHVGGTSTSGTPYSIPFPDLNSPGSPDPKQEFQIPHL
ncbi:hypothetical protein CEXT_170981 [Caerostris extrusa]|uniref:Uncharacterized protein n=1 Tax=Caerostris extrusa TaxID=172846 RepID=A0AAV4XT27_CAEEX|nr:hypothetical protein CEXT_170981 [Caerostris extrusa]